jgi:DNA-binding NtrC family response regulator
MEKKPRVLVVDDEARFRRTLAKMLRAEGLTVAEAASGEAALRALAEAAPDVVMLDIRMPGMSGLEALEEIKRRAPLTEVIMLTGHASLDAALEIMRRGGYDYVLKPCPLEELLVKIESAFEKKMEREKIKADLT